jgi:phosphoglycolate phosphatase
LNVAYLPSTSSQKAVRTRERIVIQLDDLPLVITHRNVEDHLTGGTKRMKSIVFDLDGTLIHSAPDLHASACKMLEDFELPTLSLDQVTSFVGNGVPTLVPRCVDAVDGDAAIYDDALARFREHYLADPIALTAPYPGVIDLLTTLKSEGFNLGICTNKSDGMTTEVLRGLGLDGYFNVVVSGDTLPVRKPAPDPLHLAFEKLGASSADGLYVGDSEVDAETAGAAESTFALFAGGYRKTPAAELRTHFIFDDFADLLDFIRARQAAI